MKKYGELLPSYLNGQNIQKHSAILDEQNWKLYEKLYMLEIWNNLNRPILFERVQSEAHVASMTVHIKSPFVIKKITIRRYENISPVVVEYEEDDLVTEYTYTYTESSMESVNVLPPCQVTVETYEGITYMKGYPENDAPDGTMYDHDEYLDIIGNLLGLPRRTYKEVVTGGQDPSEYTGLYPPYFTKVRVPGHEHQIGDLLTEDDWYYMARLKHFSENVRQGNLLKLMAEVLYEMQDAKTFNLTDRTTITEETEGLIGNNVLAIEKQVNYRNIDYSNQDDVLSQYIPLTRKLIVVTASESDVLYTLVDTNVYPNYLAVQIVCIYSDDDWDTEHPLVNAPINATLTINAGTIETVGYTDSEGTATLVFGGLPPISLTSVPFTATYDEPYEIASSTLMRTLNINSSVPSGATLDLQAWKYGKYHNTTVHTITAPFDDSGLLNMGRGELVHTPIMNSELIDMGAYTIDCTFYYTTFYSFLCLARVTKKELDQSLMPKDMIRIYPRQYEAHDSSIETEHHVTFKFFNEKCYLYYDDIYTGLSYDYHGFSDLLSFCGYTAVNNVSNGLKLESIDVSSSVDIQSAPTGSLDVLDTYNEDKWATIQNNATNIPPSVTDDGYNIGRQFYNVFQDYTFPSDTKNKVVEIEFNTETTNNFRIGFVRYDGTGNPGWSSTYFNATDTTVTTGTHKLKFISDANGEWKTYYDNNRTNTSTFTLPSISKICAIDYVANQIIIEGIRVYDTNN